MIWFYLTWEHLISGTGLFCSLFVQECSVVLLDWEGSQPRGLRGSLRLQLWRGPAAGSTPAITEQRTLRSQRGLAVMATSSWVLSLSPVGCQLLPNGPPAPDPAETNGARGASSFGKGSELHHRRFTGSLAEAFWLSEQPVPGNR